MAVADVAKRKRQGSIAVFLVVLCLAAFYSSINGAFVFDDANALSRIDGLSLWPSDYAALDRPLLYWTLKLNHAIGGKVTFGYHVLNTCIHLAAGLVLFDLVRRVLAETSCFRSQARWLAGASAAIWLVHPLQTQAVVYIVQRCESLMGLCFLLVLYCTLRGSRSARSGSCSAHSSAWYVLAVLSLFFGLASKEVAAMAPLVLLLFDRVFLSASWREVVRRRWHLYAAMLLPMAWGAIYIARNLFSGGSMGFGYEGLSAVEYLRTQPGVILYYLRQAVWPSQLCIDLYWPVENHAGTILWTSAIVVALLSTSFALFWKHPGVAFLATSFFIVLAPTSSIVPIKDMAQEHRMYLPLACLVILAVLGVSRVLNALATRLRLPDREHAVCAASITAILLTALSVRTVFRNADYDSKISLWQQTVKVCPGNPRAHGNLAVALDAAKRLDKAILHCRRALEVSPVRDPAFARRHQRLAALLAKRGDLAEAEVYCRRAIALEPGNARFRQDLGVILEEQGRFAEAELCFREALKIAPNDPWTRTNLARLLTKVDRVEEALPLLQQALKQSPSEILTFRGLAEAYEARGQSAKAVATLREARRLRPQSARVNHDLARILATSTDSEVRDGKLARQLALGVCERMKGRPQEERALDTLVLCFAENGRFAEAIDVAHQAIALARLARDSDLVADLEARREMYRDVQSFQEFRTNHRTAGG